MKQALNLLILGPQGAGKGTQAMLLAREFGIPTISVGAMYRDALTRGTVMGKMAKKYIEKGLMVPNAHTNRIVRERLCKSDLKKGVILDGYPRNISQALALSRYFSLAAVIWIDISDAEAKKRLLNRLVCEGCELNYNLLYNPSKLKEACESCAGKLTRRKDDTPSGIKKRLSIYHQDTAPLLDFYTKKGKIIRIDGEHEIDYVQKQIVDKLKQFLKQQTATGKKAEK
ncbi:nucleoside monophosphate kinase [Candidatus Uhrbacteria bacterium]|nr:nucleoside monophosphate kinase [Candidatus Uhrbacteria bacterium]